MLKIIKQGNYRLIAIDKVKRVLNLSQNKNYSWTIKEGVGEIKIESSNEYKMENILSSGKFRFYEVVSEEKLADGFHLELSTRNGKWQGYLLTKGLPKRENVSSRIVPTIEEITKSSSYKLY